MPKIKPSVKRKLISFAISIVVAVAGMFAMSIFSNAAAYNSVVLDVPRISQRPNTGDCAIASIASVEAYFHGLKSGDYTSEAYKTVYSANGNSISANWSAIGYKKVSGCDLETVYKQLVTGYPVIVHRTSSHYSVIYGYKGSSTSLELSGFLIFDVDDSYSDSSSKKNLSEWKRSYTLDHIVLRTDGIAKTPSSLKIEGNHPAPYHIKGETQSVYGRVLSPKTITSVSVNIKDSSGAVAQGSSYSANPNSGNFAISSVDSKMAFSKLPTGSYTYNISAKDSSGKTAAYSFSFKVVSSKSAIPDGAYTSNGSFVSGTDNGENSDSEAETVTVSYKAIVDADIGLNLRSGAGTQNSVLITIPNGTELSITAEKGNWAKTTYSGKSGWVSKTYIKKVVNDAPADDDVSLIKGDLLLFTSLNAPMKESNTMYSDTLAIIPTSTLLRANSVDGIWYNVTYAGKTGWIHSVYCVDSVGDVNDDGMVDSQDALMILRYSVNGDGFDETQERRADIDGSGSVNSTDALMILRISLGYLV